LNLDFVVFFKFKKYFFLLSFLSKDIDILSVFVFISIKNISLFIFTKSSKDNQIIELLVIVLIASKIFVFHLPFSQIIKFFSSSKKISFSKKFLKFIIFKDFIIFYFIILEIAI
jgi:hypothetical protein